MGWSNTAYVTYTNLLAVVSFVSGYLSSSGDISSADANNMTSGYVAVKPNTTYTYACGGYSGSKNDWTGYFFYKNNSGTVSSITGARQVNETSTTTGHSFTFTTPSDCYYIRIGSRFLSLPGAWKALFEGNVGTVTYETFVNGANATVAATVGSFNTFTPDATTVGGYTLGLFTAPKKGIYQFIVKGSGGTYTPHSDTGASSSSGGAGGYTVGYLLLEANQTVYVGAGGTCSAAFVSKAIGTALKNIAAANLYFVAGGGGGGGANWGQQWNMKSGAGGAGGGTSGVAGTSTNGTGGAGGTQSSGFAYGYGGGGGYSNSNNTSFNAGRGGDGYYGGKGGSAAAGGGGGSGYIHTASFKAGSNTYTNSTSQGGGAGSNANGSVVVTYYARAELPVIFNGTTLEKIIFNGVEIESLIYNGTKSFFERLRKELAKWSMWTKAARFLRALT